MFLQVDVFSFGIVMWEILTGEEPYANMHYGAIIGMHTKFKESNLFDKLIGLLMTFIIFLV